SGKAIADDVVRVVLVLADVVPQTSADFSPARVEELAPWIAPPEDAICRHHSAEGSERHPVARKSGRRELVLGCFADVRQAIRRLDHLTRPAVRHFDIVN